MIQNPQTIVEMRLNKHEFLSEARALLKEGNTLTGETKKRFDHLMDCAENLENLILQKEASEARNGAGYSLPNSPINTSSGAETRDAVEYRRAFNSFLRSGDKSGVREYRDMGIGSPTASIPTSVLVPQGFVQDLEVALKWYGQMLETSTVLETATGQPLPYPTSNDTSIAAELIGESQQVSGATVGTSVDVTVGNILLGAYKYSTKLVHISLELLQEPQTSPIVVLWLP